MIWTLLPLGLVAILVAGILGSDFSPVDLRPLFRERVSEPYFPLPSCSRGQDLAPGTAPLFRENFKSPQIPL